MVYQKQEQAFQADCAIKSIPTEDCSYVQKLVNDFTGANYWWVFLSMFLYMVSNVNRAIRWKMLLKPLGYRPRFINAFMAVIIGYFGNLGFPRIGELMRPGILAQYEKINFEKAVGTVVVSRIVDVVMMLITVLLALILVSDQLWPFIEENMKDGSAPLIKPQLLYGVSALVVIVGIVIYFFRKQILAMKLAQKIIGIVKGFVEGIKSVGQVEKPFWFIFHSVSIWVMYFLMVYVCFFAFAPTAHLSAEAGLVVFVFGAFGFIIPSPGGMGTYHFLAQTALMLYGVSGDDGFSYANIAFISIQIGCNVIFGIISLVLFPILNRHYTPSHNEDEQ